MYICETTINVKMDCLFERWQIKYMEMFGGRKL